MTTIDISQNLRPLKLAYVVRSGDMKTLERVIKTNSFLWGARYNPVLPLYRTLPKHLRDDVRSENASQRFLGSIKFFEPDFLVLGDGVSEDEVGPCPCEIIKLDEITDNIVNEGRPGFGVGLTEVLRGYYDAEHKFVRRTPVEYYLPSYSGRHQCFLRAVLGDFPDELATRVVDDIRNSFGCVTSRVTIDNYLELLKPDPVNLFRANLYEIDLDYAGNLDRERHLIYLLDPSSFHDIVALLNLRASGNVILSVPIQHGESEEAKKLCLEFIDDYTWVHPKNPHAKHHVTLQKAPSVSEGAVTKFYKFLAPPSFAGDDKHPMCFMRHWLPAYWSQFHQEKGHVNCAPLTVSRKHDERPLRDGRHVRVEPIKPAFLSDNSLETMNPRYAIDLSVRRSQSQHFEPGVLPAYSEEVARAAGMADRREWLIKNTGITHFCRYSHSIYFEVPSAEQAFISWLASEGWKAELSDAGRVAYQMLRHLGGPFGIALLKSRKLIEFLTGDDFSNQKSVKVPTFLHKIQKPIYKDHYARWGEERFLKAFFEKNIVKLGTNLQCTTCARRSWHPLTDLDYSVKCPHCLSDFQIPSHDPKSIEWSYKTIGPFSAAGKGAGAYCVLLTAGYFDHDIRTWGGATTVLSFEAQRPGEPKLEADLALFFREGTYFNRSTETIFCECKTFGQFDEADLSKMERLANAFPGAIMVFATLNDELSRSEKKLLQPFVKRCNRYHERDRPRNPVLVLTATELFGDMRPPYCWRDKGGKHQKFSEAHHLDGLLSICNATQQIYLDMQPWHSAWEKEWERRRKLREKKSKEAR